jgi:tetratricopeptide (TPR) repeat protein
MPHPEITHNDEKAQGKWNTDVIRDLLTAAFSDDELTTLCFDHFKDVYEKFAGSMTKGQKIQLLIDFCDRHDQFEMLLELVRSRNPSKYEKFKPYKRPGEATEENILLSRVRKLLDQDSLDKAIELLREIRTADPQNKEAEQLYLEAMYRKGVRSYVREHNLHQARYSFQEVVSIDPLYEDVAKLLHEVEQHLLGQVTVLEKRRQVIRFLQASGIVAIVALVVLAVVLWPRANLVSSPATPSPRPGVSLRDTHVSFSITLGSSAETPVSASHTLTLAPGDVVLIETSVMTDNSPFPRALSFQYYAPGGRVPARVSGPRTSYIAPAQPGFDIISVLITDQATHDTILRHISVIVKEKE